MNKHLTIIGLIIFTTILTFGQTNPTCSDLMVENMEMDNDLIMRVTIRNNCSNCSTAGYCNIYVTQNSIDTIAKRECFCLFTPNNNSSKFYLLNSTVTTIPPINQLKVSFNCVSCDSIPFNTILGLNSQIKNEEVLISPNPFSSQTNLRADKFFKNVTLTVYNQSGQIVKQIENISESTITLNRDNLLNGLYFLRLSQENKSFTTHKLIIMDY